MKVEQETMIYIVIAYRFGNLSDSNLNGAYTDKDDAINAAESHREARGGKYQHRVYECESGKDYDTDAPIVFYSC